MLESKAPEKREYPSPSDVMAGRCCTACQCMAIAIEECPCVPVDQPCPPGRVDIPGCHKAAAKKAADDAESHL